MISCFHWSSGFEWGGFGRVPKKPCQFCILIPPDIRSPLPLRPKHLSEIFKVLLHQFWDAEEGFSGYFWGLNSDCPENMFSKNNLSQFVFLLGSYKIDFTTGHQKTALTTTLSWADHGRVFPYRTVMGQYLYFPKRITSLYQDGWQFMRECRQNSWENGIP